MTHDWPCGQIGGLLGPEVPKGLRDTTLPLTSLNEQLSCSSLLIAKDMVLHLQECQVSFEKMVFHYMLCALLRCKGGSLPRIRRRSKEEA